MAELLRYLASWRSAVFIVAVLLSSCGDDGGSPFDALQVEETVPSVADDSDSSTGGLTGSDAVLVNEWQVTDFLAADGSFLSMIGGTEFTFAFDPDGGITGSTGCQDYTATFIISGGYTEPGVTVTADDDGQIIAMGNFEREETADCSDEQQAQIDDVITALDGAERWVFLDPSFILRDFRSNNVLVATLAS